MITESVECSRKIAGTASKFGQTMGLAQIALVGAENKMEPPVGNPITRITANHVRD